MGFTRADEQAEKFMKIQLDNQAIKNGAKGEDGTDLTGTTPSGSPGGKTGNSWITAAEFIANDGVVNGVKYPTHGDYLRATGYYTPVNADAQIAKYNNTPNPFTLTGQWSADGKTYTDSWGTWGYYNKDDPSQLYLKFEDGALSSWADSHKGFTSGAEHPVFTPTPTEQEKKPSGALGYGAWLEQSGNDTQAAYERAVAAARRQYAMNRASFGLRGEQLGRAGLTGSGYGDYLEGKAYASMVGAEATAEAQKAEGDRQNAIGYASYLTAKDNEAYQKRVSLFNALSQAGTTDRATLEQIAGIYAKDMSPEEIESIIGAVASSAEGTSKHTTTGVEDQVFWAQRLLSAYASLGENGVTAVKDEMRGLGYEDAWVDQLWNGALANYTGKTSTGKYVDIPMDYYEKMTQAASESEVDAIATILKGMNCDPNIVDYLAMVTKGIISGSENNVVQDTTVD